MPEASAPSLRRDAPASTPAAEKRADDPAASCQATEANRDTAEQRDFLAHAYVRLVKGKFRVGEKVRLGFSFAIFRVMSFVWDLSLERYTQ